MTDVIWPERPTAHGSSQRLVGDNGRDTWREPRGRKDLADPYEETYRTCSYCGSIHPGDLYDLLSSGQGVRAGGSDWKYGWPHKFYIDNIPNPVAGQPMKVYSYGGGPQPDDGKEWERYTDHSNQERWRYVYSQSTCPATMQAKFYNDHLLELSPEGFALLAPVLNLHTGITFSITEDGQLAYSAPYRGYQR